MAPKVLNPKKSIARAQKAQKSKVKGDLSNSMDRIERVRSGISYQSIEFLSSKANLRIWETLQVIGIPQRTYNKKLKENEKMDKAYGERVVVFSDLLDFGLLVFNEEMDKFERWMKKPNLSLGGVSPLSLCDSILGMQEVRKALYRLEYGNLA